MACSPHCGTDEYCDTASVCWPCQCNDREYEINKVEDDCKDYIIENCASTTTSSSDPTTVGRWLDAYGPMHFLAAAAIIVCLAMLLTVVAGIVFYVMKKSEKHGGKANKASAEEKGELMKQQYNRQNSTSTNASSATDSSGDVTCCSLTTDEKKRRYQHNIVVNNQINLGGNKGSALQEIPEYTKA